MLNRDLRVLIALLRDFLCDPKPGIVKCVQILQNLWTSLFKGVNNIVYIYEPLVNPQTMSSSFCLYYFVEKELQGLETRMFIFTSSKIWIVSSYFCVVYLKNITNCLLLFGEKQLTYCWTNQPRRRHIMCCLWFIGSTAIWISVVTLVGRGRICCNVP